MVGRLARRVRMLGYDAAYEADADDRALLRRAAREGRILLTRDTRMPAAPAARVVILRANDTAGQLREVHAALGLGAPPGLFSRCVACNAPLRAALAEEIAARVPPHVRATQTAFAACPRCGRVYWPGTHRAGMLRLLEGLPGLGG